MSETTRLVLRIIVSVLTILSVLGMLGFAIWAIIHAYWGLMITCILLSVAFSIFVYLDVKYYLRLKEQANNTSSQNNKGYNERT